MHFLENMKVGSKIGLLIAILLAFTTVVAASGIYSLKSLNDEIEILYNTNLVGLDAAKEANVDLVSASRALRNMALIRHILDDATYNGYVAAFNDRLDKIDKSLQVLHKA
ncbi:MCP four helix bundle domain-containing protein, partial [Desulfovibrio sp. OttesenSCG-928-G15]|nr:MCP four helix bundle domain-containing protein [Desulfovibrio sp. OttesenSCG-928-G15]